MHHTYAAYGVVLRTPFPCSQLLDAEPGAVPDVVLTEGAVPEGLSGRGPGGPWWQMEPGRALVLAGPSIGRFQVEEGSRITFDRASGAGDGPASAFVAGVVLGTVLRQRAWVVLHASTVLAPAGTVAIAGPRGAGKSTLAAALDCAGFPMIADDLTPLHLDASGKVSILPGVRRARLCAETAERLGFEASSLVPEPGPRHKLALPLAEPARHAPVPLRAICLLGVRPGESLELRRLERTEKFRALLSATYGPLQPYEHAPVFPTVAAALRQCDFFRLERPAGRWTVGELVSNLLSEPILGAESGKGQ